MEIVRNPEVAKQARAAELKTRIDDVARLLDKNLVNAGARDQLEINLAEYKRELEELIGKDDGEQESKSA